MQVGIIGHGRFGQVLTEILSSDFDLLVYDTNPQACDKSQLVEFTTLEEVLACETIFYAVPIAQFEEVLKSHIPFFEAHKDSKVLIDVLSVKVFPKEVFTKHLPTHVTALLTHPMFGPDSVQEQGLAGQPIVLDQFTVSDEQYAIWKKYFEDKQLTVREMSADEHDCLAANSQGITHFIGRVLDKIDMAPTAIDTLGAKKLLEIKNQTCNDTWELFSGLQNKNPYTIDMRVQLGEAVNEIYSKLLPNRMNQEKLIVGIQGGKGSFNEEAARYYLEREGVKEYKLVYLYTTANVLQALHEAKVDRGQFAIHNSTGGIVQESIEATALQRYKIVEQFSIKISMVIYTPRSGLLQLIL